MGSKVGVRKRWGWQHQGADPGAHVVFEGTMLDEITCVQVEASSETQAGLGV